MKDKSKLISIILIIVAVLLIGLLVFMKLRESGVIGSLDSNKVVKKFNELYKSKEKQVIYYASPTCGYCALLSPILLTISDDYDMDYYYLDSTKLSDSERKEVLKKLGIEKHATPITIIVENGTVVDKLEGYVPADEYLEFFKENEMIPEDAVYSAEANITYVEIDEYLDLIKESGTNVVVIGQTTCSHCIAIKPALNTIARDYDLTIYYINVNVLSSDDSSRFYDSLNELEYNEPDYLEKGSFGTPLILIIKDGKISHYISGERTTSQLVREFTKLGLIK